MNSIPHSDVFSTAADAGSEYGDPITKQCTHCGAPIRLAGSQSPESLQGDLWSDAYFETRHGTEPPILGKCHACGAIGALAELPVMENAPPPPSGTDLLFEPLSVDDFAALLEHLDEISTQFHSYLRIRFWQLGNDRRRGADVPAPLTESERANLVGLLKLLGETPSDRLMKAQIFRQLEDFEAAEAVLTESFDVQATPIIERLRQLARDRDAGLVKIFSGDPRQAASLLSLHET